mmetsp:Transcript_4756/g.9959  ORF Transcript_4756/g.9959 Transcript_4756/m.9959 type:complete len:263 (-) Transcript_4756:70-858(-)
MKLVLWDFDWSLINENSDYYVVQELGDPHTIEMQKNYDRHAKTFTVLMREVFNDMCIRLGRTQEDFEKCLSKIPVFDENLGVIKSLHAHGVVQEVVSDANAYLIDTVLKSYNVRGAISTIRSHRAEWIEDEGSNGAECLYVSQLHGEDQPAHNCDVCPRHLCKGVVVQKSLESAQQREDSDCISHIAYVGDGYGDFCALRQILRYAQEKKGVKIALCIRKGYPLEKVVQQKAQLLPPRADRHFQFWENGRELSSILSNHVLA